MSPGGSHANQPISVSPHEIGRVVDLLSATVPTELTPTAVAKVIGPPVTAEIVQTLLRRNGFARDPRKVAQLIIDAKTRGAELQRRRQVQERVDVSNRW